MSESLEVVLSHGERERDAQRLAVQRAGQALSRLQAQDEELRRYHAGLVAQSPGAGGRAVSIDALRGHFEFVARLSQALVQSQAQCAAAQRQCEAEQEQLVALEVRLAALRKLIEQRRAAQERHRAQREQRHSDDAAAQRLLRQRGPTPDTTY